jgi:hypothetical protein
VELLQSLLHPIILAVVSAMVSCQWSVVSCGFLPLATRMEDT